MSVESVCDRAHAAAVNNHWLRLLTLLTRVLLAAGFIPAGLPKILGHRFTTISTATPVGSFFEAFFQAQLYYRFVGFAQILAGCLLLFPRTATLGAVLYLPIIVNIFLITVSVGFGGLTPVITGLMLLADIYLLCWDYDRWKSLLPGLGAREQEDDRRHADGTIILALLAATVFGMGALNVLHRTWLGRGSLRIPLLAMLAGMALALAAIWLNRRLRSRLDRAV